MKRLPIVFSTIFLISIVSLMSISSSMPLAEATSHPTVTATVDILKKGVVVYSYFNTVPANGNVTIDVDLNKRDEGRFDRFCDGFHTFDIVSSEAVSFTCIGKGPWDVRIDVTNAIHTLDFPITIQVNAT